MQADSTRLAGPTLTTAQRLALLAALALATVLALGGCASAPGLVLHEVGRADLRRPGEYINANAEQARQGLRIDRGGQALAAEIGMALATGDVIESGPGMLAVIRFPEGHEATLLPRTKVQIGSLTTFFGDIYVRAFDTVQALKERFKVKTEYVTAGVEGTAFWVRVAPDHSATFGVVEGRIELTSPGAVWQAVPVLPGEVAAVGRDGPPVKTIQPRDQVDAIVRLMRSGVHFTARPPPMPRLPANVPR